MVDKDGIDLLFHRAFRYSGAVTDIDDQGKIHLQGSLYTNANWWLVNSPGQLPVQFGEVSGDFDVAYAGLTTLEGCPTGVGGEFLCLGNKLVNLQGGPDKVGGIYKCHNNPLTSVEGLAKEIGETLSIVYSPTMPSLRCLVAPRVRLFHYHQDHKEMYDVEDILNDRKWAGKGKKGSLMCAAALIKAGFEGNARW